MKPGDIFYASWGYDQTNINFVKVVEVSSTGKTALCTMIGKKQVEPHKVHTEKKPDPDNEYGKVFRLQTREQSNGEVYLRGSYPYIDGEMETGTRLGTFYPWDRETISETNPLCGH